MANKKRYMNTMLPRVSSDEELFILRGQDITSPVVVIEWIKQNILHPECSDEKLREAFGCALKMRRHPTRRSAD